MGIIAVMIIIAALRLCSRRCKSKPVMQKVENSNKVNAARGETLESSAQNGSTEMVPVDAAAHDEKIEDAILHNPEDVNEEAENAKGKTVYLWVFIGCPMFFTFLGGITLLVMGILISTDAYVCGGRCGKPES